MFTQFQLVEAFHLRLLSGVAQRLRGRRWALKGGVCLRLFHRSPRLSEDMDLDVDPGVGLASVQKAVGAVLGSAALPGALAPLGLAGLSFSAPKQTATTQRWKARLMLERGGEIATKVEFSRRGMSEIPKQGVPDAALLATLAMAPFAAPHYVADAMARQKTTALASPGRNAARDLFDLDHLLNHGGPAVPAIMEGLKRIKPAALRGALDKTLSFTRADMTAQVLPFLPSDLADLLQSREGFTALQDRVARALEQAGA